MNKELLKSKYAYILAVLVLLTIAGIIGCGILYHERNTPAEVTEETEPKPEFINQIKLSGTVYTLPIKVQEFENCGFSFQEEDANIILKPSQKGTYSCYDKNGYYAGSLQVRNYSAKEQSIHDCQVIALEMNKRSASQVEWYKGIDFYSTSSEIFRIYGKPDDERMGLFSEAQTYEWEKDGYSIQVQFEKDKVHKITLEKVKM